jgi:hypothetical protein
MFREENSFRVYEKCMLRVIFGSKTKSNGNLKKNVYEELCNL